MALALRNESSEPVRRDPFAEIQRLFSQLSRIPDNWAELATLEGAGFIPLADVEETDDAYILELELPGVKKSDIDIAVVGRRLTISGQRKEKERTGILRRRTRTMGRFQFDIQLPGDVDEAGVVASLDEGVLNVRVPKETSEKPRHIQVK